MRRTARLLTALVALIGVVALAACNSSAGDGSAPEPQGSGSPGDSGPFPVTIEHAFGETTISEEPTRVAAWGFGSADAAIALGVTPVAIPQQRYGGDAQGMLPWIKEALESSDAEMPTMLSNPDGGTVPYEEMAAAEPDVILANYSGLTQEQYTRLSEIAPTVAYPDQPWATPWRDVVTTVGEALGKAEEAEQLVADTDQEIADKSAQHPELDGKTVAAVWDTGDAFYVYKTADPRVKFLNDLGLENAPSVQQLATDESTFYYTLSYEQLSELTSDVLLVYADTQKAADAFEKKPYAQAMQQVDSGHVAPVVGSEFVAAVSPPTVLSLTWGVDDYLEALSGAV